VFKLRVEKADMLVPTHRARDNLLRIALRHGFAGNTFLDELLKRSTSISLAMSILRDSIVM
jgi:hypothetical protein